MKQSLLSSWCNVGRTLAMTVGSPSAHRRGTMLKLLSVLVLVLTFGVGNVWGDTNMPTSGQSYRFKAVIASGTGAGTYYLVAPTSSGAGGTTTTESNGTIFTFTKESNKWYVTFVSGTTTYYMYGHSTNGSVSVSTTKTECTTVTTNGDYCKVGGTKWIQFNYNNGNYKYGCYTSATGCVLAEASSCSPLSMTTVTATPGNGQIALSWPAVTNASSYTVSCKVKSSGAAAGTAGSVTGTTTKSCTITGLSNGVEYTWSVMPVGTGSYCAENTPATGDATPNQTRTITYYDKDGSHSTTLADGTNIATALNALYGVGGPTSCNTTNYNYFVGWKDGEISGTATSVTLLSTEVVNATTAAKTYYAVWSDKDPSSGSWTQVTSVAVGDHVVIAQIDDGTKEMTGFNTTITTANNFGTGAAFTTSPAGTMIWTVEAGNSEGSFAFKNSNNYYLNLPSDNNYLNGSTTKNNYSSWTIQTSSSRAAVTNVQYTTRKLMWNKTNTRFSTYAGKSHGNNSGQYYYYVIFYKQAAVSANYITTCCSPLDQINGSVNRTSPTSATLTWDAVTGAEKYQVKVPGSSSHIDWTDATSGVSVTGLACGTAYTAYFRAIDTNGSHCSEGPESSTSIPASSWTVTSTGVTNVTASPAIPATTCNGFSTTITAATGYALPENITVTNADKTWNSSTGALTISNVTGDVTLTIAGTCVKPSFTAHPQSKTDYLTTGSATALSYTASAAGASLTQQWQISSNNVDWADIDEEDGGTAATYTPNIATEGTKYYRVVVTNSECDESKTSDVATITSTEPSGYCISVYKSDNDGIQSGFSNGGDGNEYTLDFTIPGKDGSSNWPQYWIGENNAWASFSAEATFADMKFTTSNATLGLAEGATGKLHIWDDNKEAGSNLWVKFEPSGYGLMWGGEGEWDQPANTKAFTVDANNANTYWTELVTLDGTNNTTWSYYVGLQTASGYVYSGVDNENSDTRGISRTRSVADMKVSNGTSGSYKATNLNSEPTGSKGKFCIWNNNISDYNFVCHWVPFYQLTYNGNGAAGSVAASDYICCEESAANRTIKAAANGFTVPTGKQFAGWATSANGEKVYDPDDDVVLTSDVELFAVWTDIDYTVTVNQSPDVSAETTGQTTTAHYNGTINLTTTVPSGYVFVNWTSEDVTITNPTSADGASFTMPNDDVAVTANFAALHTVTLNAGGGSVSADGWTASAGVWTKTQAGAFTLPSATPSAACGTDGWIFDGWVTDKVTSETTDKPATVYTTSYTPSADIILYALYKNTVADGPAEYTLVSSAANFTDGTYVVGALDGGTYYFMDGNRVNKGLGVETTGLASSSVVSNKFPASSLPTNAVEIDVEDDGEPSEDDHYYFMSYTSGNNTYYLSDGGSGTDITWTTETEVSYHPNFNAKTTDGCCLLSLSGTKVSQNGSNKESFIRNYASTGNYYNDIYFFKKGNSSSTHYTSNSSCVKYTLSSAVTPDKGTVTLGATQLAEDATTTAEANVTDDAYRFAYWTISGTGASLANADGEGKSTDNPVTVTMGSVNATVTAHFEAIPPHTVTWSVNGVETTKDFLEGTTYATIMADAAKPAVADDAIKTNCGSDKFMGWATSAIADDATYGEVVWYNEATTLADDQTFYAVWATGAEGSKFVRMQELSELESASKIAIVNAYSSSHKILKTDLTAADAPSASEGKYTFSDGQYWTLEKESYNYKFKTSTNYLALTTTPTSSAKTGAIGTAASGDITWTITTNSHTGNGTPVFTIASAVSETAGLEYNSGWIAYYGTSFNTSWYTLELYVPEKVYSAYRTYCCNTPETALSITGANSVAVDNTLSPGTAGGNGGPVVWSIKAGGTGAATINPSTGVLTPSATGTVTIKAHQDEYNNKCAQDAEMLVEIVAATVNVTGVSLDHTTAALLPGESIQLTATITPANATDQTIGWVSGTPATATVVDGLVTAVAKGTSTVTVTTNDGDFTDDCEVTVHGLTIELEDETGTTIDVEGVEASADGRDLTASATVASKYVFYQWEMVTASGMSIPVGDEGNADITLSGTPTGDVTIKAIFYKPVTIAWLVDGEPAAAGSQTLSVARGTLWSALTPAAEPAGNALGSCATAFVGWSNSMDDELRGNGNPAPAVLFKNAQISSYGTEITEPVTFRAVFATSASGATFDGTAGGQFYIYANVGGTYHYAKAAVTSNKLESTTSVAEAGLFTFTKHATEENKFTISIGDNYYAKGSGNTDLKTQAEAYWWTLSTATHGSWHLESETNGRGFMYQDYQTVSQVTSYTRKFGCYSTSNADGDDYFDVEIAGAASYSNYVTVCCTPYTITKNVSEEDIAEGKTITTSVDAICDGMKVTLGYNASCPHFTFNEWIVKDANNVVVSVTDEGEGVYSFTMPESNVTVTADWTPVNYKVTIASAANGTATVKEGYATDENGKWIVPYGETVTLQATPTNAETHYFSGWTLSPDMDVQKSQAVLPITMTGSFTATPSFAQIVESALTLGSAEDVYSLSATLANGDPITNMNKIKSGTELKVTYELSGHNEYVGWTFSVNSVEKSAEGTTVTFNMPEEDLNVSLNTRPYYLLNLSAEHGSITGVSIAGEAQDLAAEYIVHENEVVILTAAPENENYKFKEWTGANVNANGQFTVGTSDLDVTAVFELKDTYTLTLMALGREQEKIEGILEGESIWEQIDDKEAPEITGQLFLGWSLMEDEASMIISENDDMPIDDNYPLYAIYQEMTPCYVKVTSTSDIKNGKYLIVYEAGGVAFNGGLETLDATNNTIGVTINTTDDYKTIEISETTTAAEFTINTTDHTIRSASGKYIDRTGGTSGGGFNTTENNPKAHSFSIDVDGNFVDQASANTASYLRYNKASDQKRFRYFVSGQESIQLYKRAGIPNAQGETASIPTLNVTTVVDADDIFPDGKAGNIIVENGGKLTIGSDLTVNDFTIKSTMGGGESGQVTGTGALNVTGDAYIDITLGVNLTQDYNTPEGQVTGAYKAANQWHAFTVPFPVDVLNGIYDLNGNKLANEVDYAIMEYLGEVRAEGKYGWKKFRGVMVPGTFYIMTVNGDIQTFRMKKTANGALVAGNSKAYYKYASSTGNNDNGWNGIGNPNLFYGTVNLAVQVLDPSSNTFKTKTAGSTNFVVGTPFFYQAENNGEMVMATANAGANYAPARVHATEIKDMPVSFGNEEFMDELYVSASEEALNEYETGKDLVKMTMTNTPSVAQIFGMAYNTKLCMVNTPLVNNKAEVALELYAPADGEYTISAEEREDATVYLLYEGRIIWNLSAGAYTSDFVKGNNAGYGIRVVKAPKVTTGIENEPTSDSLKGRVSKVVIDNNVFILRNGQMFDVTGKMAK